MGGSNSSDNDAAIAKLRQFQQQNNSNQQLNAMYTRQGLGAEAGARSRANPWEVRNEAGSQDISENAVQIQGIQNDFIIDKFSIKLLPMPGSNEIRDLNFKFECEAPQCQVAFYQKVEEIAEVDQVTK